MARSIHRLTPDLVRRRSKKPGLYGDGGGLYLRVKPPAACSWAFRYMLGGKAREMGLGSYPGISLPEARELAREARALKAAGKDPIGERESQRARERQQQAMAKTFRECATAYVESRRPYWKNAKHAAQWTATLETYAIPIVGDRVIGSIERPDIIRVLDPIWLNKNETARRVRQRIEAVLDWATIRGHRTGENPARWKALKEGLPRGEEKPADQHHAALAYRQLPAFLTALTNQEGVAAEALRFTILTAVRTGEAIGATWDEIDFEREVWTIPALRTKTKKKDHRVPLSKAALAVLRARHKATGGEGFVFPGLKRKKPISNMAMLALLGRMGRDDVTVHGFRSTFRDWAEETTNFPGSVAEAALGHVVGDKVEAAYRRGDLFEKRRKLMAAWGGFCTAPAAVGGKVVPIRKARA